MTENQVIFVIFARKFFNHFLLHPIVKTRERITATSLCMVVFFLVLLSSSLASPFEIDVTATIYKVIDGDTFDAFPVGRIRLADINAPELGDPGGYEAKEALMSLVSGKIVYLDVDDKHVMDRYGRLVCVVYVRVDSETIMNVNKWLLEKGYVEVKDYDNEFNPGDWNLFERYIEGEGAQTPKSVTVTVTKTVTQSTEETVTIEKVRTVTVISPSVTTEKLTETVYSPTTVVKGSQSIPSTYLILIILVMTFFAAVLGYAVLRRR